MESDPEVVDGDGEPETFEQRANRIYSDPAYLAGLGGARRLALNAN